MSGPRGRKTRTTEAVIAMAKRTDKSQAASPERYAVTVKPDWQEVERLREFTGTWASALLKDPWLRDRVAMVTAELLENAFRHGSPEQPSIHYEASVSQGTVLVRVVSETQPGAKKEELAARIAWLANFATAREAYMAQVKRIVDGQSVGLGLARIAYEGDCRLTCRLHPDGRVEVEAQLLASQR